MHQLEEVLQTRRLPKQDAAKIAGRLTFASLSIFGRLASAPLRGVYRHQLQPRYTTHGRNLYADISRLRTLLLDHRFRRALPTTSNFSSEFVLFTDAKTQAAWATSSTRTPALRVDGDTSYSKKQLCTRIHPHQGRVLGIHGNP